ncbi:MAG TPA: N-acetylglucosamine-6-phosphate deacetylase [Terriglobales bacterium]|nr:N-acetylglucosamine-6-phosphate deacetylase [Terriglobales bacterium]
MLKTLTARTLITADAEIQFPVIHLDDDGRLVDIGSDPLSLADETTVLASALIDVHMHGGKGIDVMHADESQMRQLEIFLAEHGVGHFLPTTVTASVDSTLHALERMAKAVRTAKDRTGAVPLGIHIEGPFLSHVKRGMHPAEHLQPPSIELFERMQTAADGQIRMMTVAPEPNAGPFERSEYKAVAALELIRHASQRGVACSVGHTHATAKETVSAIEAGAVTATHTFNAMRAFDHREPGVLGTVLDDERLFADLICDGVHVSPAAVRLWWRCKGPKRAILITDALPAAGAADGEYQVGNDWITAHHGRAVVTRDLAKGKVTLAGSVLTLEQAVIRFAEFTSASIGDGIRLASHNPAAMLNSHASTTLAAGSLVNLTRWDAKGNLITTYVRGREFAGSGTHSTPHFA